MTTGGLGLEVGMGETSGSKLPQYWTDIVNPWISESKSLSDYMSGLNLFRQEMDRVYSSLDFHSPTTVIKLPNFCTSGRNSNKRIEKLFKVIIMEGGDGSRLK